MSALLVFAISRLYSAIPPLTIVSVGNEPRGGAFNPSTNKGVVSNHNSNTVSIINATTYATTTVTVGSHPYGVAVNNTTNKAYIANEQSDSVSVLTLSTNTVSATIPAGANPRGIAVNATTNVGVVANSKANTVSILNLATNAVTATLTVGTDPEGVVINTANNSAYVTNYGSNTVSVINLANNTVTATINVGLGPMGIDINTTSAMIMVANRYSNTVSVINPATNTVTATINVGLAPFGVAVNSSTGMAYVSNEYSDSVSVIKMSTNTIMTTYAAGENPEGIAVVPSLALLFVVNDKGNQVYIINLANPPTTPPSPTGTDPEGVVVDPSTNTAVTANSKTNNLSVINLSNTTVIATISVGKGPQDVALNPNTKTLVTANSRDNTATIIDYPSRTVLATVNVGNRPKAVAIDPGLNIAVVANELDGTLSLINLATYSITATLPAGSHPADIAINPNTHIAVVANKKTDLVTVINLQTQTIVTTISVGKDPVSVSINPNTNIAVVSNQKSNSVSIINLNTNTVTTTVSGILNPMGSDINLSTNIAAIISHEVPTLTLIDLSTNTVSATLSGTGPDPEDVAINPNTNIAVVTNETSLGVSLIQLPNPVPILTSLSPSFATAGGSSFTLLLTGSRFVTTSTITFSNLTITPQFISTTQLSAEIPSSAITTAGSVTVNVFNPTPGGGKSNGLTFTINPASPSISSITPSSATAGGANFQMIIMGSQFAASSTVNFSGTTLTPAFVSSSQLNVTIPASNIAIAGLYPVKVVNTGGLNSNSVTFTVNNPAPGLTGMTPVSVIAGSGDTKVTLTGSNFVTSSTVNFSGQILTPQFVNSTTLNVTVPASSITSAGLFPVKVTNPGPGGGTSSSITFTVNNAVPFLTSLTPNFIIAGGGDTKVTLTGSNFVTSSTINYSGQILTPQFVNSTTLNVTIPASGVAGAGLYPVNVSNPAPGGGLSNSATFTVNNPAPILTALSPAAVVPGSGEFRLTLSGNNFVSSSTITFDNQLLIPSFINSTQINVTVPGSLIASAHTATITLNNPTPGGGISNILNLIVNSPPVANAGINQNGTVGTQVTLDGRKSYDPDPGDLIAFHWSLLSIPAGSTISLENPTFVTPVFTPDIAGTYQVQLIVNDGKANSVPSTVTFTAHSGNSPPNADGGGDLSALVGQIVTLDARKSLDPDNDKISYQWSLLSAPAGSTATVLDSTSVIPSITPDQAGSYQVQLVVTDAYNNTGGAIVNITASNANGLPMAKAGRDQNALTGSLVILDGTGSKDPGGNPLTYQWSLVSVPSGSITTIANSTSPNPAFTPDKSGDYLIKLVVNNGTGNSSPGIVLIRAASPNAAPNAIAGADQLIYQTDTVTLDGSGSSDPNGDPITFNWQVISIPAGSNAAFLTTTVINPTFMADVNGSYVVRLTVSDGVNSSFADLVVVKTKALLSISLSPVNPAITLGQSLAFTATGTFIDSTTKILTNLVTWSSSSATAATINSSGTATGLLAGTTQITAGYGSIISPAQALTINNPVPQLVSISPASINAGNGDILLTITGSNFVATSTVTFSGQILTPQYISSDHINVTVPAAAITTTGAAQVSVTNPAPGGGTSNSVAFAINNPVPNVGIVTPPLILSGSGDTALYIIGSGFIPSSVINFSNQAMPTVFVSSSSIMATIPAAALTSIGNYSVSVFNPFPGGGFSNNQILTVNNLADLVATFTNTDIMNSSFLQALGNPKPLISTVSPVNIVSGSGDFLLTLNGSSFVPGAYVNFDSQVLVPGFLSTSQIVVTVPSSAVTVPHTAQVTAFNPAPGGGPSAALSFVINPPGIPPVAVVRPNLSAQVGVPITLDGRNSYDPQGNLITFSWSLLAVPAGSATTISNFTSVIPVFTPDIAGPYQVQLTVNNGTLNSLPGILTITAYSNNTPPNADAGPDQPTLVGHKATLDGRKSSDPNNRLIYYQWNFVSVPQGSVAQLEDAQTVYPYFSPDVEGTYVLQLVVNNGVANSLPAFVNVVAKQADVPPIALIAHSGDTMTLTGVNFGSSILNLSWDPNGLYPLTSKWAFVSKPAGSSASLAVPSSPAFLPDLNGEYILRLVVNNGISDSKPATIIVEASAPDSGPNAAVYNPQVGIQPGTGVYLTGNGYDQDGTMLITFNWITVSKPNGSSAALSILPPLIGPGFSLSETFFVADLPGTYVFRLTVNDGVYTSFPDTIVVDVPVPLVSLDVTPVNSILFTQETEPFTATATLTNLSTENISQIATWTSTSPNIATISSSGVATGMLPGTTQIIATYGSVSSPPQNLTVLPKPQISSLSLLSIMAGSGDFQLSVFGSNFMTTSAIKFNGQLYAPQFISTTQLNVTIPTAAVAAGGVIPVTVIDLPPNKGVSNAVPFNVINPVPVLNSLSLQSIIGQVDVALTLFGSNFVPNSMVSFDNQILTPVFISTTQLSVTIPKSISVLAETAQITVVNPAPGGGTSNAIPLTVIQSSAMISGDGSSVNFTLPNGTVILTIPILNQAVSTTTSSGNATIFTYERAMVSLDGTHAGIGTLTFTVDNSTLATEPIVSGVFRHFGPSGKLWQISGPDGNDYFLPINRSSRQKLLSSDGSRVLLISTFEGDTNGNINVYNINGQVIYNSSGAFLEIDKAQISPNGKYIFIQGYVANNSSTQYLIRVIGLDNNISVDFPFDYSAGPPPVVTISSDGRFQISYQGNQVILP